MVSAEDEAAEGQSVWTVWTNPKYIHVVVARMTVIALGLLITAHTHTGKWVQHAAMVEGSKELVGYYWFVITVQVLVLLVLAPQAQEKKKL